MLQAENEMLQSDIEAKKNKYATDKITLDKELLKARQTIDLLQSQAKELERVKGEMNLLISQRVKVQTELDSANVNLARIQKREDAVKEREERVTEREKKVQEREKKEQ